MRKLFMVFMLMLVMAFTTANSAMAYANNNLWNWFGGSALQNGSTQPSLTSAGDNNAKTALSATLSEDENYILQQVNAERTKAGLAPLTIDQRLVETARTKSQDMIDYGYFDHQSPDLGSPFDQMNRAGITYQSAGENIAGNDSAAAAMTDWMNSPGHRANIL
ncbi:MAG TPA: CAP domain-containing protein, partial [Bacillota bacterium]|nr:CAP domain-containing protein [Bacillota bacterium]